MTPEDADRVIRALERNAESAARFGAFGAASAFWLAARMLQRARQGQHPCDLYDDLRASVEIFKGDER